MNTAKASDRIGENDGGLKNDASSNHVAEVRSRAIVVSIPIALINGLFAITGAPGWFILHVQQGPLIGLEFVACTTVALAMATSCGALILLAFIVPWRLAAVALAWIAVTAWYASGVFFIAIQG
jgi:predicted Co/Zn/Cd cation transporter (cation efflux family)